MTEEKANLSLKLDMTFHKKYKPGELIERIDDTCTLDELLQRSEEMLRLWQGSEVVS